MKKSPFVFYQAHTSARRRPANLSDHDEPLFAHEFCREIKETQVIQLDQVNILKDTIFSLPERRFYTSLSHEQGISAFKLYKKVLLFFLPYQKIDKAIWIIDERSMEYFHWLTDALPRLITVREHFGTHPVILPLSYKQKPYIRQSLALLNFEIYYYNQKKRLQVNKLFTATHTAETGNFNAEVINKLRASFVKDFLPKEAKRKIYISREKALKRTITNENQVQKLLLACGYEIHFFENYEMRKQIELMMETDIVIGLHGAGLTNILFMAGGSKILELRNEGDNHNNCYYSMASALGLDYFYQTCPGSSAETHTANITVDMERLKHTVLLMEQ